MLSDQEMHERMANGWRAGHPETICGNGSLRKNSEKSRAWLPQIATRYDIKTVCDAGAGDMYFVKGVDWQVDYRAFDLIPRNSSIEQIDITRRKLPDCDAILCRMVLNHLDEERILMALKKFKASAHYLIATQFDGDKLPQRSPQFARLDLRNAPYDLGEPLDRVQDGAEGICSLAIWQL